MYSLSSIRKGVMETIDSKIERLRLLLSEMGVVIGYSGGCDSTLLAAVGKEIIKERMVCVMASSETYPARRSKMPWRGP
jgi:uncharacterized protein